jgi:hypothetical protein
MASRREHPLERAQREQLRPLERAALAGNEPTGRDREHHEKHDQRLARSAAQVIAREDRSQVDRNRYEDEAAEGGSGACLGDEEISQPAVGDMSVSSRPSLRPSA